LIKKLFLVFLLAAGIGLLYLVLSQQHRTKAPAPGQDDRARSFQMETSVQQVLEQNSLVPVLEQHHPEQKDGRTWEMFFKKFRMGPGASLADMEQTWKNLSASSGFKVWQSTLQDQERPRAKILDLQLGTPEFATHHLVFIQPLNPQVALIIDDMGYDGGERTERLLNLGVTVNLSVIPGTPHGQKVAEMAYQRGDLVMLHMPMEPLAYPKEDPGPWGVYVRQGDDEIKDKVEKALAWVPHAEGFNNHMGSRATADRRVMEAALSVAQQHGIFFVDSLTDSKSVAHTVAQEMKIPCAVRDVFLDDEAKEVNVEKRMAELERKAKKKGYAVAIGHPRPATVTALEKMVPQLVKDGIEFVAVRELVH